ncbi:MAG: hypothetical protein KKB62_03425 [Nanoarchaeota archaeon]|nr:hypothetical protein [Nanoarchaeota archaeon]
MVLRGYGLHHLHLRKRMHSKREKFPSPDKKIRFLDNLVLIVSALGPLMTIPQLLKIFIFHDAEGVSFVSWTAYTIFSFVWLAYGFAHKVKPIIVSNILWIVFSFSTVVGIILYGNGFL